MPEYNKEIRDSLNIIYRELLEREIDESGFIHFYDSLISKKYDIDDIRTIVKNSKEYSNLQANKKQLKDLQQKIYQPIFIIGVPRSGTTLLYNILCSHQDLAWLSDSDIDIYLSFERKKFLKQKWISYQNKIPVDEDTLYVFGKKLGDQLRHFGIVTKYPDIIPIEGEVFLKKFFGNSFVKDIAIDQKIKLLNEVIDIIKRKNKKRFLNKAPQNCMRLFALKKCFPDAKFINIYRNPVEVISSMQTRYKEEGGFDTGIRFNDNHIDTNLDFFHKCILMYKEIIISIKEFEQSCNDSNFMNIFYEDLTKNPVNITKKILDFCGLESREIEKMIPKISVNQKNSLSQDNQEKLKTLQPFLDGISLHYQIP